MRWSKDILLRLGYEYLNYHTQTIYLSIVTANHVIIGWQ